MQSFKKIFSLEYHPKLIKNMAEVTIPGAFATNILVGALSVFILYDFLPHDILYIWLFLQSTTFIAKVIISKKLLYYLKRPYAQQKTRQYFALSLTATSFAALLYGVMIGVSYSYHIPDIRIVLISTIIILMAASSISTLGNVILAFILFVFFTVVPLVGFALFHGGETFAMLAFISLGYMILHTFFGYRQYIILRNSVFLEETFKSIYEKSSDGIMLIKENRFLDGNDASVKMFGYRTKEELLTTHLSRFMPKFQPDGKRSVVKMLEMVKIALQNGSHSFEWLHKKRDGELFWTEIVLTKITLDAEELLHGVWRDIEDRKKLEIAKDSANKEIEALNQSLAQRVDEEVEKNREKEKQLFQHSRFAQMGEMIAMIAHQWRQPLSAISSTTNALILKNERGRYERELFDDRLHKIVDYSQYLSATIDDFRNFFKPDKTKQQTTFAILVESALNIVRTELESNNITLQTDYQCQDVVFIYANEIRQVILNMIKNAEDALLEKSVVNPTIMIRCYSTVNETVLEVEDNAGGIDEAVMEKIFDPYITTKSGLNGTGLGLYMSKIIVEEHSGGTLTAVNIGNGALFKVILYKIEDEKEYLNG